VRSPIKGCVVLARGKKKKKGGPCDSEEKAWGLIEFIKTAKVGAGEKKRSFFEREGGGERGSDDQEGEPENREAEKNRQICTKPLG